jgi:hypothetical protein
MALGREISSDFLMGNKKKSGNRIPAQRKRGYGISPQPLDFYGGPGQN